MSRSQDLIAVLLDSAAKVDERDDAAMDLAAFPFADVEAALLNVAHNLDAPELVRASCGASLAEIWLARGSFPQEILCSLPSPARQEAESLLRRS